MPQGAQHAAQTRHAHHGYQHIITVALGRQRQGFLAEHPLAEPQVLGDLLHGDGGAQARQLRTELPHLFKQLLLGAVATSATT